LSAALVGYWRHPLSIVERIAAIVAGVLLIFPDRMVGLAGLAILTGLALLGRKNKTPAGAE
jgi:TRAP-type uncharacterized transport system fused permease subunit